MGDGAQAGSRPPHAKKREDTVEQKGLWHCRTTNVKRCALRPQKVGEDEGNADQRTQQRYAYLPARITPRQAIGEHAADQCANGCAATADYAHQKPGLLHVEAVGADQKTRAPGTDGITGNGRCAAGKDQPEERRHAKQLDEGLHPAFRLQRRTA